MLFRSIEANEGWLDQLTDGVVLIAGEHIRYLNRTAAEILEVDPEGVADLPLITALRDHRLEHAYLQGVATELETRGYIVQVLPIEGGLLLRDVTALRQSQRDARELLAVLSHEFRTPVTAIRATLEALRLDLPDDKREHFLTQADSECARLVRLLEDLTVEVTPPRARRVVLSELITRAAMLLEPTLERERVALELIIPDLVVWADVDKLLQAALNLIENAAVHGPSDAVVEVTAFPGPDETGGFAHVVVRDRGVPLEPELMAELFKPHTRSGSGKTHGTGLGLYIVRSIVEKWRGSFWGKPLEQGNEFGFTVPMAPRR